MTDQDRSSDPVNKSAPSPLQQTLALFALPLLIVAGLVAALKLRTDSTLQGQDQAGQNSLKGKSPFQVFDLKNTTVPRNEILSGGPLVDGIPALSDPKFLSSREARFLAAGDRVIGVQFEQQARAYPLKILDYHEAVNDQIGKVAFVVTYCPLCDSAAVFDRRRKQGVSEFGISGLLYNSNVLMYDRTSKSLWSQVKSESVSGPRRGQQFTALPLELTTWEDWRTRHPDTLVLSTKTGYRRDYSRSPYVGYFASPRLMFDIRPKDHRLPSKTRVLGIWGPQSQRAYPIQAFSSSTEQVTLKQSLDGLTFTLRYHPQSKTLRVVQADDGLQWLYSFWFAWANLRPRTELFDGQGK